MQMNKQGSAAAEQQGLCLANEQGPVAAEQHGLAAAEGCNREPTEWTGIWPIIQNMKLI